MSTATNPSGVARNTNITGGKLSAGPAPGQLLVTDRAANAVNVIQASNCLMVRSSSLVAVGPYRPGDAAWDLATGEIVVSYNGGLDSLYTGLDVLADLDLLAVSSAGTGAWALLDRSCQVVHARSGEGLANAGARLSVVEDIAWLPEFGRFLVAGGSPGKLGVATFEGATATFEGATASFVPSLLSAPSVAADPNDPGAFYALDSGGQLWHYSLPGLTDAPTDGDGPPLGPRRGEGDRDGARGRRHDAPDRRAVGTAPAPIGVLTRQ